MADITKISESLGITISLDKDGKQSLIEKKEILVGSKRRAWLENSKESRVENKSRRVINPILSLLELRGNPLKVAQYIFELSKDEVDRITKSITRTEIIKSLTLSKESVKTAVQFLIRSYVMERITFKIGKSGSSTYKLKLNIFKELEMAYQKGTMVPLQYINTSLSVNTNTGSKNISEWDDIDISQLEHIGLKMSHIYQLKTKNSFSIVQESIYNFAYGLKFNSKVKSYSDPLSVLIGVLRKGEVWLEPNYRSAQEIAQEEMNSNMKSRIERVKKLAEDAFNLAFSDWETKLSEEEIIVILKDDDNSKKFIPKKVRLRTHFNEQIWQTIKSNYLLMQ